MKKILSLVLATAMVTSMGVSAFAGVEDNSVAGVLTTPFAYDTDDDYNMTIVDEAYTDGLVPYGTTIYYAFQSKSGATVSHGDANYEDIAEHFVHETDAVQSVSIRQSWEMGAELIAGVTIVKKKVHTMGTASSNAVAYTNADGDEEKYFYFLAIEIIESSANDTADIVGVVTLKKSSGGDDWKFEGTSHEYDLEINVEIGFEELDDCEIQSDYAQYTFSEETEEYITFEASADSYFIVDTNSQDSLVGKFDTTYNTDIADHYPTANLHFFSGYGLNFNQIGELNLSTGRYNDTEGYLYEIVEDYIVPVTAEYDDYENVYRFYTRTIGQYVISDIELQTAVSAEEIVEESFTLKTVKPNPPTGGVA